MPMVKFVIYFVMLTSATFLISARLSRKPRENSTIMRYVLIISMVCWFVVKALEYARG